MELNVALSVLPSSVNPATITSANLADKKAKPAKGAAPPCDDPQPLFTLHTYPTSTPEEEALYQQHQVP